MKRLDRETKKMTVRLFTEDLEYLRRTYKVKGYNSIIRALAARHVTSLKNIESKVLDGEMVDVRLTADELRGA